MSRSFSAGNYTRHIQTDEDPFTSRVMAFRNDDASGLKDDEKLTADEIKTAGQMFERKNQKAQDEASSIENGKVFLEGHPEWVNTEANIKLMNHELQSKFGVREYTLDDYEQAYQSLRASGFLKLNKAELERQEKASRKQRFEDHKTKRGEPTLEDLYSMPLADLRRLDAVEHHNRMQRRGEEGGW